MLQRATISLRSEENSGGMFELSFDIDMPDKSYTDFDDYWEKIAVALEQHFHKKIDIPDSGPIKNITLVFERGVGVAVSDFTEFNNECECHEGYADS